MNPLVKMVTVSIVLLLALVGVYRKGYESGAETKQAAWDADNLRRAGAQRLADQVQQKRFDKLAEDHRQHNIEVSNEHQIAVDKLAADLATARAAVRAAGGLRIPATVCSSGNKSGAKAGSDVRHDADPAGTVALPEAIEGGLFDLAAEADRVTEVARACQSWVLKHGFYNVMAPVEK